MNYNILRLSNDVVRVVYLPPKLDDQITTLMKNNNLSRSEVMEELLMLGMTIKNLKPQQ
jgi:hypothetical protein